MGSAESIKLKFESEIKQLNKIHNNELFDDCIYVGSGDSYVVGLIVEYLTNHKCICYSPSDLFKSRFVKDSTYCFISVTGNTRANIEIARRARQAGARTVAITLDKYSKLAKTCDELVLLQIKRNNPLTESFSTFVANIVTCLQIIGVRVPSNFEIWYRRGLGLSASLLKTMVLPRTALYILGNNSLYALALYASLKMTEFFCTTAVAYKLEEFCHSPIFGIKKSHHLWIMGQKDMSISKRLEGLGFHRDYFELYRSDIFAQLFESIFFVQNLMLLMANRYGKSQSQYLLKKDLLNASSEIIYGN
jgi:fructoselysine-6-P-deglycase FrlB-like protein